ncbi:MAG: phenylalanine--tRNA ligase subunit beta, partial [Nitrospirae bacterium]|nr:phenylalanine--tRNA ligase subunit beta [Nitrospirota bacterium]
MLLVFEWLTDFISIKETPAEISDLLTMAGLEIESMEEGPHGVVLDVNVTPNRPDCLSVTGLARELSAILGRPIPFEALNAVTTLSILNHKSSFGRSGTCSTGFNVEINSPALCARYTGRAMKGVKVAPSPEWIRLRLTHSGIRPINNVVDVTNYVMLETGQPLHAFDSSRLKGDTIKVESANSAVKITTLDGVEREVAAGTLLIWDAERPIAVAGVMGGQNTEVTDSTTEIFLESACFSPASVRRTAKALNLRSESSYRFERGVDVEGCVKALDRATGMLVELCPEASVSEIVDVYPVPFQATEIRVNIERLNR